MGNYIVVGLLVNSLALYVTALLLTGIRIDSFWALIASSLAIGVVNTFIRPFAQLISIPLTVITFGLFALVVNAGMLGLAAWFVPGFHVDGFWAAFWGAILISICSSVIYLLVGPRDKTTAT